ncbi:MULTISPECIES: hypothetical protein [Ramlibacter]|uniref:DUF2782 domain-containing protein n=1 Tax=Ramlibacter aquaticus TaxID=2780094 RepID=A0ABR9SJ69_9BURK|nr:MULTISPECIES: hypothetical protein [Ramlibacter]MBE7942413.1 hypothetical protein [Ramlibacter aquaticus]
MRSRLVPAALALAASSAFAQAAAPLVQEPPPLDGRHNQKVEVLHTQDDSVAIDEVRYAGQVQSTTVTPLKSALPAYEMQPPAPARASADPREPATTSRRVWNVFGF